MLLQYFLLPTFVTQPMRADVSFDRGCIKDLRNGVLSLSLALRAA